MMSNRAFTLRGGGVNVHRKGGLGPTEGAESRFSFVSTRTSRGGGLAGRRFASLIKGGKSQLQGKGRLRS